MSVCSSDTSTQEARQANHEVSPRGQGNAVSIEFNLLYRWHSALSKEDTKWTEEVFEGVLGTKDFSSVRSYLARRYDRICLLIFVLRLGHCWRFCSGREEGTDEGGNERFEDLVVRRV